MKKIIFILLILTGCKYKEPETKWFEYEITNLRIDDDSEYHFTYTNPRTGYVESEDDVYTVEVYRNNISKPIYRKLLQELTQSGKKYWVNTGTTPQIILPINYKIETFDD